MTVGKKSSGLSKLLVVVFLTTVKFGDKFLKPKS